MPARNTVFLSLALAYAEVTGAESIFFGVNAIDYSGYPDCRPQFIEAFAKMANLATKAGVESRSTTRSAPAAAMTKAEIIRRGVQFGVDYGLTHSCYDPDPSGVACGRLRRLPAADQGIRRSWACRSDRLHETVMRIAEIYRSVQGEGLLTGTESVFIRASGCNLRCWYCDTPYASWSPEGDDLSIEEILSRAATAQPATCRGHGRRTDALRRVDSAL